MLGRLWNAIQASPLGNDTLLVMVSDHGMNTQPGTYSQGYNLVQFFNSLEGGAHHVLTNRHPMQMYKLRGLDPFVDQVITASPASLYLGGKQNEYPTAQLDLDGNERAGVQLRNSDLNALQIAFQQKDGESTAIGIIDRNRPRWSHTVNDMAEELAALRKAITRQNAVIRSHPGKSLEARRLRATVGRWEQDEHVYSAYVRGMRRLLDWKPGQPVPAIPEHVMGDPNTVEQLRNYVVGPGRQINYLAALTGIRTRNNPQPGRFAASGRFCRGARRRRRSAVRR